MATIAGTIEGMTCLFKESQHGNGTRETWLLTCSFGVYSQAADDASLAAVGAAIDANIRDGKTSTLRGAVPVMASPTGVYFSGATVQALTVSSDSLTGELNNAALTETDSAATTGMAIAVIVDRA